MGKIYVGQNELRVQLTCSQDVTSCTCKIQYRKPDGTTGSWDAVIGTAATGVIYYDVTTTAIIDQPGTWRVWAFVTFTDSKVAYGEAVDMVVHSPSQ
jgi:hypothetical protein